MNRTLHNAARWLLLGLAMVVIAAVVVALACGPSSPAGQDDATPTPTINIIDGSSPSTLATAKAQPTATPYPPGYVPPTDLPTFTPIPSLPTLKARMEQESAALRTEEAQASAAGAVGMGIPARMQICSRLPNKLPWGNTMPSRDSRLARLDP